VPIGGAIITPSLAVLIRTMGWRHAALVSGSLFLCIGVPLTLMVRKSPESMGLAPDGEPLESAETRAAGPDNAAFSDRHITATQALRFADFLDADCLHDRAFRGFHHGHNAFHSDMVWKGLNETEAFGAACGLCPRQSADPFPSRLDRRFCQQTEAQPRSACF
jgi:hypothetical protein